MGIRSTKNVSRQFAIDRINLIKKIVSEKNFLELSKVTFEEHPVDVNMFHFINYWNDYVLPKLESSDINNWTDTMLEDILDLSFVRESMFDNYLIEED